MNEKYREWLGRNYVADTSMHRRTANFDLDHHLLGNGIIQAVVQITKDASTRNAIVVHLMNPDRFEGRNKTDSLTYHQQLGPEYTFAAVVTDDGIHLPNPRQTATDLQYGLRLDSGTPTFWATYPLDYTFTSKRSRTSFSISETMFVPEGHSALLRRITVANTRGLEAESAKLLLTLTPNQEMFPRARYDSTKEIGVATSGDGDEAVALAVLDASARYMVAEFPTPLEAVVDGTIGSTPSREGDWVVPKSEYGNYPLLPGSAYVGAMLACEIDLGVLAPGESRTIDICYSYGASEEEAVETAGRLRSIGYDEAATESHKSWSNYNAVDFGESDSTTLYAASRSGLHASVAKSGRMNAGIWGYNAEWVRDSSGACVGVILSGQHEIARQMLSHLLKDLVDDTGMAFGESRFYSLDEAELDQNGELLYAVWQYWMHSRDEDFIREYWDRIKAVAELPLRPELWIEEAQMVQSTRDIRERDFGRHGLELGFDLGQQMWVAVGLAKAADMAKLLGEEDTATLWNSKSTAMWDAVVAHPEFALVEDDHFMFRRKVDGTFQREAAASAYIHRPSTEPITQMYPINLYRESELEPSAFEAWPIALGLVDPSSDLAKRTLVRMEALWNDEWDFGGYGLQNANSEISKAGAWFMSFYMITQAAVEAENWDTVTRNIKWVMNTADSGGYMWWEYRDADPDRQIDHGVIPWLSFGEAVTLLVRNILGFQPLPDGVLIRPRLIPGKGPVSASLRVGGHTVDVTIHNGGRDVVRATIDGEPHPIGSSEGLLIPVPEADARVEIWTE